MSDQGRKGFGEQVKEKATPQSQKSNIDVASEYVTGAADKVAAAIQPSSEKSATQKAGDSIRGNTNSAQGEAGSYLESAQKIAGDAAQTVSDTLMNAADYVTGNAKQATNEASNAAKK